MEETCCDGPSGGPDGCPDHSPGGLNSSPSSWENVDEKEISDKVL